MTLRGLGKGYIGFMQNKGSALVFVFVLFIMCLGTYVAVSTFMKGRGANVIALETLTPTADAETTVTGSAPVPTDTPMETPTPHSEVSTPIAPTATPIPPATPTSPLPPTPTPSAPPTGATASPTPVPPVGGRLYSITRNERDCSSRALIGGKVFNTDGSGLPGVSIHLYNDFGWSASKSSEGPPQAGKYEFTMGAEGGLFHLVIVDNIGQELSAVVDVDYQPDCSYYVDWQRVQ